MDCSLIKNAYQLTTLLRSEQPSVKTRVANCFYDMYYAYWCRLAVSKLIKDPDMQPSLRDEFLRDAFNDGISYFFQFIIKNGYEEREATVKTFFLNFCVNKLLGILKADRIYGSRYKNISPEAWEIKIEVADEENFLIRDEKENEEELKIIRLRKGMNILGDRCKKLIIWRKLNKWSNDKIATQLGIDPGSVNNEVFRCMSRLKKIIDGLK